MSLLAELGLKPRPRLHVATATRAHDTATEADPGPPGGQAGGTDADTRFAQPTNSASPQATLVSIDITPKVTRIDGEGELRLTATGTYSDGSRPDITFDVDWHSSDEHAVTVDVNGVARGVPVTGRSTISATDAASGISGELDLEVVMLPRHGPDPLPPLKSIEITPPGTVQAYVNSTVHWGAIGVHTDGTRVNMSAQVEWRSSDEKVAHFGPPLLAHDCYAFAVGTASISARSGKITSAATTLKVVERPAPQAPPKWLDEVRISFTRPGGGHQWVVGETFEIRAEGTYTDRSRADLTKKVRWWSDQPNVTIDTSGRVKVLATGATLIHANWEGLGKVWPETYQYFRVDVLGAAPKAAPKAPATGKLTRATALAFVASLSTLAGHRHDSENAAAIKAKPTGDRQLDALLDLVADVARKWGSTKTVLEARQTWGVVMPRLVALIKEAAGAAAGLEDKDLNPARNAVNDMHAWVQSDPGARALQNNYVHKVTPFGQLAIAVPFIRDDMGQYGADDVLAMLGEYEDARSASKKLAAAVLDLDTRAKQMQKVAGDAAALEREVRARANEKAQDESKHYRAAARDMQLLRLHLSAMQTDLEEARAQVAIATSGTWVADANNAALKELHELATDQGKGIDVALSVVKTGLAIAATGPVGLLEVVDLVKDVRGVFQSSDLFGRAEKAVQHAASMNSQQAQAVLVQAQAELASAEKHLKEAESVPKEFLEDLRITRDDAEAAYDRNAGGFAFKALAAAIQSAEQAEKTDSTTLHHARRARNAAAFFSRQVDFAKRRRFEGENERILLAIAKDAATLATAAEVAAGRITTAKTTLSTMRSTAHRAIFTAQDAKRKGTAAPKKAP